MKVASFFSGIGGFDLGLENAGMEVVFQCEIDDFANAILKKHWPQVDRHTDIQTLDAQNVPQADLYCGGFPCQDLSLANQGKRQGLKGNRSGLFFKFAELLEANRPKWVVIENVPGLLNSNQGQDFRVLLQKMDELGYGVAWRIFDAKYFGTPQRRRRVFIVASYQSISAARVLFEEGASSVLAQSRRSKKETTRDGFGRSHCRSNLYSIQHAAVGRKPSAGPQAKGYRNDGETWTLDSRGSSDVVCAPNDAFGVRDFAGISPRLDSRRYRALGNAVCVPVVEWIGRRILEVESEGKTDSKLEMPTESVIQPRLL